MGNPASATLSNKKIKLTIGNMVFSLDRDESLLFNDNLQTNASFYGYKPSEYFAMFASIFQLKGQGSKDLLLHAEYLLVATQLHRC